MNRRSLFFSTALFFVTIAVASPGAEAPARTTTVLFDEAHDQRFLANGKAPLDLSHLAQLFEADGCLVGTGAQQIDDTILSGADVLVISGPFRPYTPDENAAVVRFLDRGGRLAVMLHIAPPLAPLLDQLGVWTSNGVIRERENIVAEDPLNFHVTNLAPHALTNGVTSFDMFGVWALLAKGEGTSTIAKTSAASWVDLNHDGQQQSRDAVQSFAVIVAGAHGAGRFVVFGDDALFQNSFLEGGNEVLARNLVRWLK